MEYFPQCPETSKIKVIGVGGGGCNAINRMIEEDVGGVKFIEIDTDPIMFSHSKTSEKIQLVYKNKHGFDGGGDPENAETAAECAATEICSLISNSFLTILVSSLGGGTGTGATPVVARIARQTGAMTICLITYPFSFENSRRLARAIEGSNKITNYADILLVHHNDRLFENIKNSSIFEAFKIVDYELFHYVERILWLYSNLVKMDLESSDIRTIMS